MKAMHEDRYFGPGGPGPHGPGMEERGGHAPHRAGRGGPDGGPRGPMPGGPVSPGRRHPPRPRGDLTQSRRYREDSPEGKLAALLRALGHRGRQLDDRGGQGRVLAILREDGETTQRALTENLGIQPGSASEILAKLEGAGFVVRTPSLSDRRTSDVSLTEAGEARAAETAERSAARRQEMFAALTDEEKSTLIALLEKLYGAWEEKREEEIG